MSKYEKLGGYVLFEKTEEDKFSKTYLAGQIAKQKVQQIVFVRKFDHSLSTFPDFVMNLKEEFEDSKMLANPGISKPVVLIQEKSELDAVFDFLEGKILRMIITKCQHDRRTLTVYH